MVKARVLSPQSVWDVDAVRTSLTDAGIAHVDKHTAKLWGFLIRNPQASWHDVPDFPEKAKQVLDEHYVKFTSKVHAVQRSTDGETFKLLLELQDGLRVEAVVMEYDTSARGITPDNGSTASTSGNLRSTLCVSSQVGCQMGCTFCATGTMGLKGNLSAGEIIEQLAYANQFTKVRNVVYMGMGEPLDNYAAVKSAVQMMTDNRYFSLSRKHVTVSTVGVISKIASLPIDLPGISLALSLHAPTQELRSSIVPSAKAHKLDKLMAAVREYTQATGQKVFIEYVMMLEVNDNEEQAHQLGALLQGIPVTVNLIPWNPVYSPGMNYGAPGLDRVTAFRTIVKEEYGLPCTIRQEKGQEISGACGQLVVQHQGKGGLKSLADIEEIAARLICSS